MEAKRQYRAANAQPLQVETSVHPPASPAALNRINQLQRTIGNQATMQLVQRHIRPSVVTADSVVQPKLRTGSGRDVDKSFFKEKGFRPGSAAAQLVEAEDVYWLGSEDRVELLKPGNTFHALPHGKHLIGESHDASKFHDVTAPWPHVFKMLEGGKTVDDGMKGTVDKVMGNTNANKKLPLENLHAYSWRQLMTCRYMIDVVLSQFERLQDSSSSDNELEEEDGLDELSRDGSEDEQIPSDPDYQELLTWLSDKDGYEKTKKTEAIIQMKAEEMATILGKYLQIGNQEDAGSMKDGAPYAALKEMITKDILSKLVKLSTGDNHALKQDDFKTIITLSRDVEGFIYDNWLAEEEEPEFMDDLQEESFGRETYAQASKYGDARREQYMAQHMNQAGAPLLVKIGSNHVPNLVKEVSGAVGHASWQEFDKATTFQNDKKDDKCVIM